MQAARILLSLFFSLSFVLPVTANETEEALVIGVMAPLSGTMSRLGTAYTNGMQLAYGELSEAEKKRLKIVIEDDGGMPKNTLSAWRKLRTRDKASVMTTVSSSTSKAVSALADAEQIPLIAIASDYEVVKGKSHAVALWVTPESEVALLFPEMKRRGYKKIARITAVHDGTLAFKSQFDVINDGSVEVVLDEEYDLGEKNFRSYLSKVRQDKDIDAIFLNLFLGQNGIFARQARELGISLPLFAIELFEDAKEVELSNGALLNQWYIQADEGTSDFVAKYKKAYPGESLFGAANGYDVVHLLNKALGEGRRSAEEINTYLHSVQDHDGALGRFSSTDDNRFSLPATVKIVTKEGFRKVSDLQDAS